MKIKKDENLLYMIKDKQSIRYLMRIVLILLVVFVAILGSGFLNINAFSTFPVKAQEIEQQNSISLNKFSIINQPERWGGCLIDGVLYVEIGLQNKHDDISIIELSVKDGFFAKQYTIDTKNNEEMPTLFVGGNNRKVIQGSSFDAAGSTITLNNEEENNDFLLFWALENVQTDKLPQQIEICERITLKNGFSFEQVTIVDISGEYALVTYGVEETEDINIENDYYMNIPLEECELIEDSVKTVIDEYEYASGDFYTSTAIVYDEIVFDENNQYRVGYMLVENGMGIVVVERGEDGLLSAMIYLAT